MFELAIKWLTDLKVLVGISAVLNLALVAVILGGADDVHVKVGEIEVVVKTLTLDERIKALFGEPTQRPQVRALLEQKHFFEIGPDNPRAESIAEALTDLANRHSAHALVSALRDMSRRLSGPFKGFERPARIIATKGSHALSQGFARVCLGSGFEDMFLTIWGTGHAQGGVTVHAEKQRDCPTSMLYDVELHFDDWKAVFDETDPASQSPVFVRLHPPRVEVQRRQVSVLTLPTN
jgi:hypothetical protein